MKDTLKQIVTAKRSARRKKSFDTEQEELKMARFLNTKENIINKMVG